MVGVSLPEGGANDAETCRRLVCVYEKGAFVGVTNELFN